jgi:hypothetical protein
MASGLEDLYASITGAELPPYFLFGLGALCSPAYIKDKRISPPKMFFPNAGLPRRLYEFLKDVIGLEMRLSEGRDFHNSLSMAKKAIDNGAPALIGACDMYHLAYLDKFYHQSHIPIHYFLMTGYDDAAEQIVLLDCSRAEPQRLSYADLEKAWDVSVPGFSKKNTLRIFSFPDPTPPPKEVFFKSLKKKSAVNLCQKPDFIGVSAFEKLANEIPAWQSEMTADEYRASLRHLVEYCGFPPSFPDKETTHTAARPEFADLLKWGAYEFNVPELDKAAELFYKSGAVIATMVKQIVPTAVDDKPLPSDVPELLREITALEKQANEIIISQ